MKQKCCIHHSNSLIFHICWLLAWMALSLNSLTVNSSIPMGSLIPLSFNSTQSSSIDRPLASPNECRSSECDHHSSQTPGGLLGYSTSPFPSISFDDIISQPPLKTVTTMRSECCRPKCIKKCHQTYGYSSCECIRLRNKCYNTVDMGMFMGVSCD